MDCGWVKTLEIEGVRTGRGWVNLWRTCTPRTGPTFSQGFFFREPRFLA
jgi:hypothetical protein